MLDILNTYKLSELKKFVSATNIKGYSKLSKPELIKLMMREENIDRFKSIRPKGERDKVKGDKVAGKLLREFKKKNKEFEKFKSAKGDEKVSLKRKAEIRRQPTISKKAIMKAIDNLKITPKKKEEKKKLILEKIENKKLNSSVIKKVLGDDFYKRTGFTDPKDLPKPPKFLLDEPKEEKQEEPKKEEPKKEEPKAQAKQKEEEEEEFKVSKIIKSDYPQYVDKVRKATEKGLLPNGGKRQRMRFLFELEFFNDLKSDEELKELNALGNILERFEDAEEGDTDGLDLYKILFGKVNKKEIEKRYIDLIFFLLESGDKKKQKLGSSAVKDADEKLQRKLVKRNKALYLRFVSSMADKTGLKQKEQEKEEAERKREKKQFEKDLAKKKAEEEKEQLEIQKQIEANKKKKFN